MYFFSAPVRLSHSANTWCCDLSEESFTDEPATWFASVDGSGAILNPYLSNDLIVFANTDGDAIAFDGWIIRSVVVLVSATPCQYLVKTVFEPLRLRIVQRGLVVMSGF